MDTSSTEEPKRAPLQELVDTLLANRHLILASNRGPVEYHVGEDGQLQPRRGSGGVVTALNSLLNLVNFTWIASAMGEGDRRTALEHEAAAVRSPLPGQRLSLRYIVTPRRVYHKYYNVVCNPLLWFLQHYMWSSPYTPNIDRTVYDAWENGYVAVNEAFAQTIAKEAQNESTPPCIMLHDYHLYLVAGIIRKQLSDAVIQHFIHIPWPNPSYWQLLPATFRRAVCESLCAADIVGFQTMRDVQSFLLSCEAFLPEAQVDYSNHTVRLNDLCTQVRTYPISIDVQEIRNIATSPRAQDHERRLRPMCGEKTIVRVDRTEPSKNIVRGFRAFETLLQRYPDLIGRVKFLAFLVPSRTHIRQYQRYLQEVDALVQSINATYGTPTWQPITVFYENNYTQAVAGMRLYDVLLVNSVIDGMNLVAKEGPVVNTKNGVLILSETAGAHEQLSKGVLSIAPADVEGTVQALQCALTMSDQEREERATTLVKVIKQEDIYHWLQRQMEDICALTKFRSSPATSETTPLPQPLKG